MLEKRNKEMSVGKGHQDRGNLVTFSSILCGLIENSAFTQRLREERPVNLTSSVTRAFLADIKAIVRPEHSGKFVAHTHEHGWERVSKESVASLRQSRRFGVVKTTEGHHYLPLVKNRNENH